MPHKIKRQTRKQAIAEAHEQAEHHQREWFSLAEKSQQSKKLYQYFYRSMIRMLPENRSIVVNNTRLTKTVKKRDGKTILTRFTSSWPASP